MLVVIAMATSVMVARLTQLTLFDSGRLSALSASQTVRAVELPGERGTIIDRNGHELALSVPQTTVWADPREVDDPVGYARTLAPILGVPEARLRDNLSRPGAFTYLARQIDDEQAAVAQAAVVGDPDDPADDLAGVYFFNEPRRFSPSGDLAEAVVGRVGIDNDGRSGLERLHDGRLSGEPGELVVERAPDGVAIPAGRHRLTPPAPGEDLVLTIDRSIQFEAERLLAGQIIDTGADGGSAVVMDVRTGDLLALANLARRGTVNARPAVADADAFSGRSEVDVSSALPPGVVQAAKVTAVTDVFEPGSVNKVITVAAAIEEGVANRWDTRVVPDNLRVADHTFTDHSPHETRPFTVNEILVRSSNIGTIQLGQELGKERLDSYLRRFGFGTKTGLGFPGESAGLMLAPEDWSGTTIGTVPIGQGVSVTPLQMLEAYATIANGGTFVTPRLVLGTIDAEGVMHPSPAGPTRDVVSASTAATVTQMLVDVVDSGTGRNAIVDGYRVAGKTGTARKPLVGARGYEAGAYLASFAGFVPAEDPRLAIIVVLDEPFPIYGGVVSAPVFADLAAYSLRHLRVPPPASAGLGVAGAESEQSTSAPVRGEPAATTSTTVAAAAVLGAPDQPSEPPATPPGSGTGPGG